MLDDADAELAAFCERHHRRLLRMVIAYVGDRATAEELVQDTLVRVCRDWRKVREMDDADAWVTTVGFNMARSWFRRQYAGRRARRRLAMRQVEAGYQDNDDGIVLLAALRRLPDRQRQAVVLRFLEDRSVAEAAQIMGCAPGTVKAHTSRAVEALRAMDLGLDVPAPADQEVNRFGRSNLSSAAPAGTDSRGVSR